MGNIANCCSSDERIADKQLKFEPTPTNKLAHKSAFGDEATGQAKPVPGTGGTGPAPNAIETLRANNHLGLPQRQNTKKKQKVRGKYADSSDNETSDASMSVRPPSR